MISGLVLVILKIRNYSRVRERHCLRESHRLLPDEDEEKLAVWRILPHTFLRLPSQETGYHLTPRRSLLPSGTDQSKHTLSASPQEQKA